VDRLRSLVEDLSFAAKQAHEREKLLWELEIVEKKMHWAQFEAVKKEASKLKQESDNASAKLKVCLWSSLCVFVCVCVCGVCVRTRV